MYIKFIILKLIVILDIITQTLNLGLHGSINLFKLDSLSVKTAINFKYSNTHSWTDIPYPEGFSKNNCIALATDGGAVESSSAHIKIGSGDKNGQYCLQPISDRHKESNTIFLFYKLN